MDVRKYLESYEAVYLDAKSKFDAYKLINCDIGGGAINYDGMPHGTLITSRTENDAIRLNEKFEPYYDALNEAGKLMLKIDAMIERVSFPQGRYVLRERYLCLRSIEEIGYDDEVDRTGRQTRNYHDRAIEELERIYG